MRPSAIFLALVLSFPLLGSTLLDDPFDGTSLDLTKWAILDGSYGISVGGGWLTLSGPPDHKRVNSLAAFAPPAGGAVTVTARVYIGNADYQKFGFNVNPMENPAPSAGFYFDTYESAPDTITAIVAYDPGGSTLQQIPLAWGNWYELAVRWTSTDVTFLIDGVAWAQFANTWTAPLPVGVWNDRPGTMHADWVRVDSVTFDADGDGIPDPSDQCPDSNVAATVVIDGCDSGAANTIDAFGCTLADGIEACAASANHHGQFVACVAHLTSNAAIRRCAARSSIP